MNKYEKLACEKCFEVLKEVNDKFTDGDKHLNVMKWINIDERLPDQMAILAFSGGLVISLTFIKGIYYTSNGSRWCDVVTHWMPSPKPPIP